jgi:hypothetical protein
MNDSLIKIDPKLVDQLVKEHIQIAVAEAISKNGSALVNQLVAAIINTRVDRDGIVQSHSPYNTQTWLDYAIAKELRQSVLEVIQAEIKNLKPQIEKSVRAQFTKSTNQFAKAVADGLESSIKYDWNFKLTLGTEK